MKIKHKKGSLSFSSKAKNQDLIYVDLLHTNNIDNSSNRDSLFEKEINYNENNNLNRILRPMELIEKQIYKKFHLNYFRDNSFYNIQKINEIIYNENSHMVAEFKDYLIKGDYSEFLVRFYPKKDIHIILSKILEYYSLCSIIFPNYVALPESKYIYKNIQKKQKVIDLQQEQEDKKENAKNGFFEENDEKEITVFTTRGFDSILNQTDTSGIKQFFGISNEVCNNVKDLDRLIENIDKIEKNTCRKISGTEKKKQLNLHKHTKKKLSYFLMNGKIIQNNNNMNLNTNLNKFVLNSIISNKKPIKSKNSGSKTKVVNNEHVHKSCLEQCKLYLDSNRQKNKNKLNKIPKNKNNNLEKNRECNNYSEKIINNKNHMDNNSNNNKLSTIFSYNTKKQQTSKIENDHLNNIPNPKKSERIHSRNYIDYLYNNNDSKSKTKQEFMTLNYMNMNKIETRKPPFNKHNFFYFSNNDNKSMIVSNKIKKKSNKNKRNSFCLNIFFDDSLKQLNRNSKIIPKFTCTDTFKVSKLKKILNKNIKTTTFNNRSQNNINANYLKDSLLLNTLTNNKKNSSMKTYQGGGLNTHRQFYSSAIYNNSICKINNLISNKTIGNNNNVNLKLCHNSKNKFIKGKHRKFSGCNIEAYISKKFDISYLQKKNGAQKKSLSNKKILSKMKNRCVSIGNLMPIKNEDYNDINKVFVPKTSRNQENKLSYLLTMNLNNLKDNNQLINLKNNNKEKNKSKEILAVPKDSSRSIKEYFKSYKDYNLKKLFSKKNSCAMKNMNDNHLKNRKISQNNAESAKKAENKNNLTKKKTKNNVICRKCLPLSSRFELKQKNFLLNNKIISLEHKIKNKEIKSKQIQKQKQTVNNKISIIINNTKSKNKNMHNNSSIENFNENCLKNKNIITSTKKKGINVKNSKTRNFKKNDSVIIGSNTINNNIINNIVNIICQVNSLSPNKNKLDYNKFINSLVKFQPNININCAKKTKNISKRDTNTNSNNTNSSNNILDNNISKNNINNNRHCFVNGVNEIVNNKMRKSSGGSMNENKRDFKGIHINGFDKLIIKQYNSRNDCDKLLSSERNKKRNVYSSRTFNNNNLINSNKYKNK